MIASGGGGGGGWEGREWVEVLSKKDKGLTDMDNRVVIAGEGRYKWIKC